MSITGNGELRYSSQMHFVRYAIIIIILWEFSVAMLHRLSFTLRPDVSTVLYETSGQSTSNILVGATMYQSTFATWTKSIRIKLALRQDSFFHSDAFNHTVSHEPRMSGCSKISSLESRQTNRQKHLYLLSLQCTNFESVNTSSKVTFSKPVADIWRWKDSVLGDGRDFFVPKPNTIRALQSYILSRHGKKRNSHRFEISECAVLSNCARFEILLLVNEESGNMNFNNDRDEGTKNDPQLQTDIVVSEISSLLLHQVKSHQDKKKDFMTPATAVFDWPGIINQTARHQQYCDDVMEEQIQEVTNYWSVLSGPRDIVHHLCLVAVGLAARPRRPNREIVFQPFSSRDAHILLQLKRTVDIIAVSYKSANVSKTIEPKSSNLLTLLKFAIQAGKAARNPNELPALMELRNKYGETGNSPKYDIVPPPETMQKVIQAVYEDVIDPIVQQCVDHFIAKEASIDITMFRKHALAMAKNQLERQFIQSKLHEPTLLLRQTKNVQPWPGILDSSQVSSPINWNVSKFWDHLSADLEELRQNGTRTSNSSAMSTKT